jgi:hypothetical protein
VPFWGSGQPDPKTASAANESTIRPNAELVGAVLRVSNIGIVALASIHYRVEPAIGVTSTSVHVERAAMIVQVRILGALEVLNDDGPSGKGTYSATLSWYEFRFR